MLYKRSLFRALPALRLADLEIGYRYFAFAEKNMSAAAVILAAPFLTTGVTLSFAGFMWRQLRTLHTFWALLALSVLCFTVTAAFKPGLGHSLPLIATLGNATCGFSWLLARALFRPAYASRVWPFCVVAVLLLTRGVLHLKTAYWPSATADEGFIALLGTVHSLTSSTALVLALIEAVDGWSGSLSKSERRFRLAFVATYLSLFLTSLLWARPAATANVGTAINVACSMLALVMSAAAVMYRASHPLQASAPPKKRNSLDWKVEEEERSVAATIMRLLDESNVYRDPGAKVADLAKLAGEPEYKVTRAITGALGCANFNQLINRKRVDYAKRCLANPACHWSILAIAMDSGFGSIGPFNRAFKMETGVTASEFRVKCQEGSKSFQDSTFRL